MQWNVNPLRMIVNLVLQLMKRSFQDKYVQQRAQIVPGRQKPGVSHRLTVAFQEDRRSLPFPQPGKSAQVLQLTRSAIGVAYEPDLSGITERAEHPGHIFQRGSFG